MLGILSGNKKRDWRAVIILTALIFILIFSILGANLGKSKPHVFSLTQNSGTPTTAQAIISPHKSFRNFDFKKWPIYSSKETPDFDDLKSHFTFRYPPDSTISYGVGKWHPFVLQIQSSELLLSVEPVGSGSTKEQAQAFVNRILQGDEEALFSCEAVSNCSGKAFSVSEKILPNGQKVAFARGPSYLKDEVFENYFIKLNKDLTISMRFSFKETNEDQETIDQILSSIQPIQ